MAITVANSTRACRVTGRSHVSGGSRLKRATVSAPVQRHAATMNIRSTSSRRNTIADAVGLFYGTTTGHTEEAADTIKSKWNGDITDPTDISEVDVSSLPEYDALVVGVPTWHTGADEMRSGTAWDDVLEEITGLDLAGKKVAIFGCGDSSGYGDYFCDAMEEMQRTFKEAGATGEYFDLVVVPYKNIYLVILFSLFFEKTHMYTSGSTNIALDFYKFNI